MAKIAGGAICKNRIAGNLSITDSSFKTVSKYFHGKHYLGGDILYSQGRLSMRRIRIRSMDHFNEGNSLIIHMSEQGTIEVNDINITCSMGKDIIAPIPKQLIDLGDKIIAFTAFTVKCSACSPHQYSLLEGKIGPKLNQQSHIHCNDCPTGGNCKNGQIKAADNFWGFRKKSNYNEIHFVACPYGYCCIERQCETYSSCGNGRHDTLCGRCKPGLVENIFTNACLKSEDCYHPWFWYLMSITGILYVLFFVYQKETANFVVAILVPRRILKSIKHILFDGIKNIFDKTFEPSSAGHDISSDPTEYEVMQIDNQDPKDESESFFPGLLKIVFFFYQTNLLLKVYSGEKSHNFSHFLEEMVTTLFNLRPFLSENLMVPFLWFKTCP